MSYIYFKEMLWEFIIHMVQTKAPSLWKRKLSEKRNLLKKRAKRKAKHGPTKIDQDKSIPLDQVITLDHLTNPEKK